MTVLMQPITMKAKFKDKILSLANVYLRDYLNVITDSMIPLNLKNQFEVQNVRFTVQILDIDDIVTNYSTTPTGGDKIDQHESCKLLAYLYFDLVNIHDDNEDTNFIALTSHTMIDGDCSLNELITRFIFNCFAEFSSEFISELIREWKEHLSSKENVDQLNTEAYDLNTKINRLNDKIEEITIDANKEIERLNNIIIDLTHKGSKPEPVATKDKTVKHAPV